VAAPVYTASERLASGARGVSVAVLDAWVAFLTEICAEFDEVDEPPSAWEMASVCKGAGRPMTVCELTASTGLSLAESIALVGERDGVPTDDLIGPATTYVSYAWAGTSLGDLLQALQRTLAQLAAEEDEQAADGEMEPAGARERFVWIDMFGASQNMLAGRYRASAEEAAQLEQAIQLSLGGSGGSGSGSGSDGGGGGGGPAAEREEDVHALLDGAMGSVREVVLYASPLLDEWEAPDHPLLNEAREPPPAPWVRRGPRALSRAWCARSRWHIIL